MNGTTDGERVRGGRWARQAWWPVAFVLSALLAACGDDSGDTTAPPPSEQEIQQCIGGGEAVADAVGVPEDGLDAYAEQKGFASGVRIVGRDRECFDRTDDLLADRLNVYLVDGKVVAAAAY